MGTLSLPKIATSSSSSSPSPSPSIFSIKRNRNFLSSSRLLRSFPVASTSHERNEAEVHSDDAKEVNNNIAPLVNDRARLSLSPLSKDAAMGLVLSAVVGKGWTTGSGMEGPPIPEDRESETEKKSTFPFSLFTKSPRRKMLVAFTCNICRQRTTRAINPHAYNDGTVFVQCCGCNAYHKLVDNLNLFHDMKCYINSEFNYSPDMNLDFSFQDDEESDNGTFQV